MPLVEEGQKRMREQAFAEAAALFEKAAEREPSSSRIHYYLGVSLMRLGRAGDAVSSLERAVALTPRTNLAGGLRARHGLFANGRERLLDHCYSWVDLLVTA